MTPSVQKLRRAANMLHDRGARFAHDLAAMAAGQFLSKLIGFLAFAYIARIVAPEAYGQVELVVGLAAFAAIVIESGLGPVGVRRIAADRTALSDIAARIPALRLLLAAFVAPLFIATLAIMAYPPQTLMLAGYFAASLALLALNQEWLLQSRDYMVRIAIAQILRASVFAGFVFLLVRGTERAHLIGAAELCSVAALIAFQAFTQQTRITPLRIDFNLRALTALWREGVSVGAANLLWALQQYAPLVIIAAVAGAVETAWFAAPQRIVVSLLTFSNVYHFNLFPTLSRLYVEDKVRHLAILAAAVRATSALSFGAALGLALLANPIVTFVFGARFEAAAPSLTALAWAIPLAIVGGHARWTLIAVGKTEFVFFAQAAGAITGIVVSAILIPAFGAFGGALAISLMSLAVWLAAHWAAVRFVPAFPSLMQPALLCALALAILAASRLVAAPSALEAIAGLALYTGCAFLLNPGLPTDILRLIYAKKDGGETGT